MSTTLQFSSDFFSVLQLHFNTTYLKQDITFLYPTNLTGSTFLYEIYFLLLLVGTRLGWISGGDWIFFSNF